MPIILGIFAHLAAARLGHGPVAHVTLPVLRIMPEGSYSGQVKKVPGVGKPEDSCAIDGAVCRKNLAHKRMCRQISNPKILMVAKNLEFNRAQSRLTSLEGMTKQEVGACLVFLLCLLGVGCHSSSMLLSVLLAQDRSE